jgi:hypothetical protein
MQLNDPRMRYILLGVAVLAVLAGIITLSVWGSSAGRAQPTVSVEAIYTAAYQTFTAQQATQQALTPPTSAPTPTLFPTLPVQTQPAFLPTIAFTTPTTGVVQGCDNSAFVSDVTIPDGTVMSPGQKFTKTWLMQNTGTCTWDTNYSIAFVSGDAMSGVKTPLTLSVPSGQQIKISVNLIAPTDTGNFKGIWQLMNGNGVSFGAAPWVLIKVSAATPTVTTAPTNTSAPPTNTSAPPTETPTP